MADKVGSEDIVIFDYTDNFSVKEYFNNVLLPNAFPTIPITKLNASLVGAVGEYMASVVEDAYYSSSLMLNENFITRAVLPSSIYAEAGLFDLGYTFASPSRCKIALQLWIDDVLEHGQFDTQTGIYEYLLDRDTKVIIGNNIYRLDYDIKIEWRRRYVHGKDRIPFKASYITPDKYDTRSDLINSIGIVRLGSPWITCRVTRKGWLILLLTLQEFSRKIVEETISDNLRTTNSDIMLRWSDQIAGFDLVHINTKGVRTHMKSKISYTDYEPEHPFAYYVFENDHTIRLSFSPAIASWRPRFNDQIEATIYTTSGASGNFEAYNSSTPIAVEKSGERYEYNADTHIAAVCYSGSVLGADKKNIEMLRSDVKLAYNTVKVLSTDHDLKEWFINFAQRYDTKSEFFKRRDDPSGRLFSQFVAITDGSELFPTNTLTIDVCEKVRMEGDERNYDTSKTNNIMMKQVPDPANPGSTKLVPVSDFDFIDDDSNEFIIQPGHIWEYKKIPGKEVVYVTDSNGNYVIDQNGNKIPEMEPVDPADPNGLQQIKFRDIIELSRTIVVMTLTTDENTGETKPAMIYDTALPTITDSRPFMFVNPFLIKLHRRPQISACYNYLIHHASYMDEITAERKQRELQDFRQFQLSMFTADRSLIQPNRVDGSHLSRYTVRVLVNPIIPEEMIGATDEDYQYVKGSIIDMEQPDANIYWTNNLRLILAFDTKVYGVTGYMEMYPIKLREAGVIEYEAEFAIHDNISVDGYLTIDLESTINKLQAQYDPDTPSIRVYREINDDGDRHSGKIILDAENTRFKITTILKTDNYVEDVMAILSDQPIYQKNYNKRPDPMNPGVFFDVNPFEGYHVTNIFENDSYELTFYQPMSMMRSVITFANKVGDYQIRANLMPFVAYTLARNESSLSKFIRQFNEQYAAVEPVIFERLDNNCHLDFKFFNTYGRSNNYYIGDNELDYHLLDDVSVGVVFHLSVNDRMAWSVTADNVKTEIREFFGSLNADGNPNIYISNLIRRIEVNHPNVNHLKFIGITCGTSGKNYGPTEQYLRVRYTDVSDLDEHDMITVVPEALQCHPDSIILLEES